MKNRVGREQIVAAKSVNLIIYLQIQHPDLIMQDRKNRGRYVHPDHDSLVITERGFYRFSIGRGGDQIQFLQDYVYGGDFVSAVQALARYAGTCPVWDYIDAEKSVAKPFVLPQKEEGQYKRAWAYLTSVRRIPSETVQKLFVAGELYQSAQYGNCVFASRDSDYAEIVGTGSARYKGIAQGSDTDGYWITGAEDPEKVYVCESAIDAISLKVLQKDDACAYASMGGLKPQTLQRILETFPEKCILAIDSDEAANKFAAQFPELARIVPEEKDWNEMLC